MLSSRGPWSALPASPSTEPSSQQTTLTSWMWGISVASRSGSAMTASAPAASISDSRFSRRVVPRTECPARTSSAASSRPRHPHPTIRTRARPLSLAVAPGLPVAPALLLLDLRADLLLGDLRPAARAAALVLGLDHLVHVLELQPHLVLVGASGLPVHLLGARARVVLADQQEHRDHHDDRAEDEDAELVHGMRLKRFPG